MKAENPHPDQVAAAIAAVMTVVRWDKVPLQDIVQAANQGRLGGALTTWLVEEGWQTADPLLRHLGTIEVPARTEPFIAKNHFVQGVGPVRVVQISYIGENFQAWFLGGEGKIESPTSATSLDYAELARRATDMPQEAGAEAIIPTLGGETAVETTLANIWSQMEAQPNGEKGTLLNNGSANVFYVPDLKGVLRTVDVGWGGGGWRVYADPVESPRRWRGGSRVFARNSALRPSVPLVSAPV